MKNLVTTISALVMFSSPSQAQMLGTSQEFVQKKKFDAEQARKTSLKRIELLRNSTNRPNVVSTKVHLNLESLEPASGKKTESTESPEAQDKVTKPKAAPQPL